MRFETYELKQHYRDIWIGTNKRTFKAYIIFANDFFQAAERLNDLTKGA